MFSKSIFNNHNKNKVMAIADIDFEGTGGQGTTPTPEDNPQTNSNNNINSEDKDDLNGSSDKDDITGKDGNDASAGNDNNTDGSSTGELNVGDQLEVDGTTYTVAENGDLVDEKGNIFKEAKDVKDWLKELNVEDKDNDSPLSLANIQETVGVTVTDENGNPVEFTNDANGVNSYINSVIELRSQELQQAAVNRLYADNPLLKQFQDYVQITGTPRGFGEIPDRSGITLDKDNEAQLVAVIRMAAQEFGNKSLNDNYIKYLRDSGGLYDEARNQLSALVEKDNAYRKEIEARAAQQREEEAKSITEYWNNVNKIINGRVIGGYKIPESFTKEVDGKKIILTPRDFVDYISVSREDDNGSRMTNYQKDLAALTDEEYLNREILDAWLLFTGGTYKDLIDMAVKEDKVRQLRVKSKEQRSNKSVKIIRKSSGKSSIDDIIL